MQPAQLQALMMQQHARMRAQAEELGDAHRELQRWEEEMAQRDEAIRRQRRERLKQPQPQQPQQEGAAEVGQVEALRVQGNELYERGAFEGAVHCYTQYLALDRWTAMHEYRLPLMCTNDIFPITVRHNSSPPASPSPPHTRSHSVLALSNRAMAHLKLQRYDAAIEDATAALAIDPVHLKSLERRAAAFLGQERYEEARRDLEAAVRLRPSDATLRSKLARLVNEMGAVG